MLPASSSTIEALRGSHNVKDRVRLNLASLIVGAPNPVVVLPVSDWSITVDSRRHSRREATVTVTDPGFTPVSLTDPLAPYSGATFMIERCVVEGEWISLGVFYVTGATPTITGNGWGLVVEGQDAAAWIARRKRTEPLVINPGTSFEDAIESVLLPAAPNLDISVQPTGLTTPFVVLETGEDPWQDAEELAEAAGIDVWVNTAGQVVSGSPPVMSFEGPDPGDEVWVLDEADGDLVVGLSRDMDLLGLRNGVIASGEGNDLAAPVAATRWDEDSGSATFRGGPLGEVPDTFQSPLIVTTDQAQRVAGSQLNLRVGLPVSWEMTPVFVLDVWDAVMMRRQLRPGLWASSRVVIDSITLGASGPMSCIGRARKWEVET